MLGKIALGIAAVVMIAVGIAAYMIGPRNIIGMWRYDQRREGTLQVGDRAPAPMLVGLDGKDQLMDGFFGNRPVVLVFGSFT